MLQLMSYFKPSDFSTNSLRLISVGSELSTFKQRDVLSKYFNCPVLDEYSSEELGWIATQCPFQTYHLWDDISYIEDTDNTASEIIGTNLHNLAMPFIRYRQGDMATVLPAVKCKCGRITRSLTNILGRKNDEFLFENGKKLSSAYLLDTVYNILLNVKADIIDFCFIQLDTTHVKFEIIPGPQYNAQIAKMVHARLVQLMPSGVIRMVDSVAKLHKTKSGKRNPIISYVGKQDEICDIAAHP